MNTLPLYDKIILGGKIMNTKDIARISLFTSLNIILSQIAINIPISPVPITLGLLGVYITGVFLKPKEALYAQICYIILGIIGFPVFSGFKGGLGIIFGPTGGYILMYPLVSFITSLAINKNFSNIEICFMMILGLILLYIGGTTWLSIAMGIELKAAFLMAVLPFVVVDLIKIFFALIIMIHFKERITQKNP